MPPPVYTPGQVLGASDCNNWFLPRYAYKTSNTTRTSNTTLAADPHLIVPVDASAMYELIGLLDYDAGATGDLKFQFTVPAGTVMNWTWIGYTTADVMANNGTNVVATVAAVGGATGRGVTVQGTVVTSSTSGNLGLNWAQNVSDATSTVLHTYSYLKLVRVG